MGCLTNPEVTSCQEMQFSGSVFAISRVVSYQTVCTEMNCPCR